MSGNTLPFQLVASGTISQDNWRFSEESRNTQCVGISVRTCAYIQTVGEHIITSRVIGQLIIEGDLYYRENMRLLGPNYEGTYINPDETARLWKIGGENIKIEAFFCWAELNEAPL